MSDNTYTLDAEIRTDLGTGASRRLRRENKVPAIVYGAGKEALSLTLDHNKVIKAQEDEGFYSHILTLNINGEEVETILKDIQRHPFKPKVLHLDFQRITRGQTLQTTIPVHFINEDVVEKQGTTVVHQMNEIEIACLPRLLPEFIEVDVANLTAGDSLHLSDITFPEGVTSVELGKGEGHDHVVVTVNANKAAPEETEESDASEGEAE